MFYRKQPTYNPQMTPGEPYDKGVRKNQLTGSYGDFNAVRVKSDGARYPTDVQYFKTAESEGPVVHATQKPVALARYLVRTYTDPGDTVLDCCFGSGSFLVGALSEGRNFIGMEQKQQMRMFKNKNVDYVDVARERLRETWSAMEPELRASVARVGEVENFRYSAIQ